MNGNDKYGDQAPLQLALACCRYQILDQGYYAMMIYPHPTFQPALGKICLRRHANGMI
jgi:hypothetical protein